MMSPPRGGSCAWCSIAARVCCCRADVDAQDGTPLTFNKVLVAKPGFQFDNPPDLHDVRASALAWNRTLQYGASARLTTALTPSTTLVSLTAYRSLDFEFFVDADITELNLLTTHQHELAAPAVGGDSRFHTSSPG